MAQDSTLQDLYVTTSAAVDRAKVRRALPPHYFSSLDAWEVACAQVERLIAAARREERYTN